jgi:hypothetical protein
MGNRIAIHARIGSEIAWAIRVVTALERLRTETAYFHARFTEEFGSNLARTISRTKDHGRQFRAFGIVETADE